MKCGDLFSGEGGFSIAAEWMGWETVFHAEINPSTRRVLKYWWPEAILYDDIKKTDFTIHRGQIDILTGGFPCQPYSAAGKRKGKADDRHLWPEMLRAIREIQPRWIVGENVFGLVNWNGGMVFDEVQLDLETAFKNSVEAQSLGQIGYEVIPFILPAAGVGAPHQRYRVFFVAYASGYGQQSGEFGEDRSAQSQGESQQNQRERVWGDIGGTGEQEIAADSKNIGREWNGTTWRRRDGFADNNNGIDTDTTGQQLQGRGDSGILRIEGENGDQRPANLGSIPIPDWENFPTQPPVCGGNDGLPKELVDITFSKWRSEALKAHGNAVVPQLVLQIFKAIELYERTAH